MLYVFIYLYINPEFALCIMHHAPPVYHPTLLIDILSYLYSKPPKLSNYAISVSVLGICTQKLAKPIVRSESKRFVLSYHPHPFTLHSTFWLIANIYSRNIFSLGSGKRARQVGDELRSFDSLCIYTCIARISVYFQTFLIEE